MATQALTSRVPPSTHEGRITENVPQYQTRPAFRNRSVRYAPSVHSVEPGLDRSTVVIAPPEKPQRAIVFALRRAIRRLVMSLIASFVMSLVAYMAHAFMEGDASGGLDQIWTTIRRAAGVVGGYDNDGSEKPSTSSKKHRDIALACIESPGSHGIDDIGGLRDVKRDLSESVLQALRNPHVFFDPDAGDTLRPPTRLLFTGPPGTGKTMLAKALARDSKACFINVTLSTLEDKYFGETPKILKAVFEIARERSKQGAVVLFFDEIDGIMRKRKEDDHSSVYGMKTEFLQHMDLLDGAVVVIGCTNHASALDPAMKRRLPDRFEIGMPTEKERYDILKRIVGTKERIDDNLLQSVATTCTTCSGSDLRQKFREACNRRWRRFMRTYKITSTTSARDVKRALPALSVDDWHNPDIVDAVSTDATKVSNEAHKEEERNGSASDDEDLPPDKK